jgi:hypothetical protein
VIILPTKSKPAKAAGLTGSNFVYIANSIRTGKSKNYLFTDFLRSAPALNFATFLAAILIAFQVSVLSVLQNALQEQAAIHKPEKKSKFRLRLLRSSAQAANSKKH